MKIYIACLLFISFVHCTYYRAAVVEYSPYYELGFVNRTTAESIMNRNLDQYELYVQEAQGEYVDIILFPEDGLYGASFYTRDEILPYLEFIPDVDNDNYVNPCDELSTISPILSRASCIAKMYNITMGLDMGEIKLCDKDSDSNCPSDNRYQYNTLVVFASSGDLVAKYHKSHLYYEPQFDAPKAPEIVWFESDFGVRFGLMICFDLMFEDPQLILYNLGIRNFLWSSWWVDEPPLITGTQVELARSLSLPSNFLASGIGLSWYNSGSGIYSYGTALKHWYNFSIHPLSKMMIADVPINPEFEQNIPIENEEEEEEENIPSFTSNCNTNTSTLPTITTFNILPGESYNISSTSNNLTCNALLRVSVDSNSGELFGVYSLDGIYNNLFPAQICAIMRCYDEECTSPILDTSSYFDYFELSGNFNTESLYMMYPMVAKQNALIIDPSSYATNSIIKPTTIWSTEQNMNVLNVALFGLVSHDPCNRN